MACEAGPGFVKDAARRAGPARMRMVRQLERAARAKATHNAGARGAPAHAFMSSRWPLSGSRTAKWDGDEPRTYVGVSNSGQVFRNIALRGGLLETVGNLQISSRVVRVCRNNEERKPRGGGRWRERMSIKKKLIQANTEQYTCFQFIAYNTGVISALKNRYIYQRGMER